MSKMPYRYPYTQGPLLSAVMIKPNLSPKMREVQRFGTFRLNAWFPLFSFPHAFRPWSCEQARQKTNMVPWWRKPSRKSCYIYYLCNLALSHFLSRVPPYDGVLSHSSSSPQLGPGATSIGCRSKMGRGATEKTNVYKSTHMELRSVTVGRYWWNF